MLAFSFIKPYDIPEENETLCFFNNNAESLIKIKSKFITKQTTKIKFKKTNKKYVVFFYLI